MTKRESIRNARARAAREFAALKGEVTPESVAEAASLLQRCIRLSLAFQRHNEAETASNFNKSWFVHEGELLEKRWCKLNRELAEYGAMLYCAGYYCVNVYTVDPVRHTLTSDGYLYFFD